MDLKFSIKETISIIERYFLDCENRVVRVQAHLGKVVNQPRYLKPNNVLSFDAYEQVTEKGGNSHEVRTLLDYDTLKTAISTVIGATGFEVSDVAFGSEGIVVSGEKKELKEDKTHK